MEPELAAVLAATYLSGVDAVPIEHVREMRRHCQELETGVSYLRRLVQGRLDIVTTELERRRAGGDPADLHALIVKLPAVLADRTRGPARGRPLGAFAPGELHGELAEELLEIDREARLPAIDLVTDGSLVATAERLADLEHRASAVRRSLFERIDALGAELARRYRTGEASLGQLLRKGER